PPRASTAGTGRWPTSRKACRSCVTTGRLCSCRSPVQTPPPRGPSPRATPQRVRQALRAREARDAGDRYTRLQPRDVPPGGARLAVARPYGQATMVGVAQLAERQVVVLDVAGSNPVAHPT